MKNGNAAGEWSPQHLQHLKFGQVKVTTGWKRCEKDAGSTQGPHVHGWAWWRDILRILKCPRGWNITVLHGFVHEANLWIISGLVIPRPNKMLTSPIPHIFSFLVFQLQTVLAADHHFRCHVVGRTWPKMSEATRQTKPQLTNMGVPCSFRIIIYDHILRGNPLEQGLLFWGWHCKWRSSSSLPWMRWSTPELWPLLMGKMMFFNQWILRISWED